MVAWSQTRLLVTLALGLLVVMEPVSWITASIHDSCIVNPENYRAYYADNDHCPTFHVFLIVLVTRIFEHFGDPNWVVADFTVILAFSTVGLWIVTWLSSKRQSSDMSAALNHAEMAVATAERAFVYIDGFNVELTTALDSDAPDYEFLPERYKTDPGVFITRFAAQPRWKNGGNTPTEDLIIRVDWKLIQGTDTTRFTYRRGSRELFIAPRAVETSDFIEMPGAQALVDWSYNPTGIEPWLLIWGRADYRDVFRKPHFIEWSYRVQFSRPRKKEPMVVTFSQWDDYNRTDKSNQDG